VGLAALSERNLPGGGYDAQGLIRCIQNKNLKSSKHQVCCNGARMLFDRCDPVNE
jgi:hypothetical protein